MDFTAHGWTLDERLVATTALGDVLVVLDGELTQSFDAAHGCDADEAPLAALAVARCGGGFVTVGAGATVRVFDKPRVEEAAGPADIDYSRGGAVHHTHAPFHLARALKLDAALGADLCVRLPPPAAATPTNGACRCYSYERHPTHPPPPPRYGVSILPGTSAGALLSFDGGVLAVDLSQQAFTEHVENASASRGNMLLRGDASVAIEATQRAAAGPPAVRFGPSWHRGAVCDLSVCFCRHLLATCSSDPADASVRLFNYKTKTLVLEHRFQGMQYPR